MGMACCYGNMDTVRVRCSLCDYGPEIRRSACLILEDAAVFFNTSAQKNNTQLTVPGGHRQPGMQARLTQGRSRF